MNTQVLEVFFKLQPFSLQTIKQEYPAQVFTTDFVKFPEVIFLQKSSGGLLLNIYSPNNLIIQSTKHCNCLGRSIKLDYISRENKINLSFYSLVKSWRVLNRGLAKIGVQELIFKVTICAIFLVTYTNTHKETLTVPYPEFFWAFNYIYLDRNINKSIGECTVRQTD